MSSGSWTNSDGLPLFFGTAKATPETGGEYKSYGNNRIAEVVINLASLTTSAATILSNNLFFPAGQNIYIEAVELVAEVAFSSTGSPTLSVGLIQDDRTTVPATGGATSFINGQSSTGLTSAGDRLTFTTGTAGAGGLIGSYNTQWNSNTSGTNSAGGYITATLGTTTATGTIRCRIYYHGVGTITN